MPPPSLESSTPIPARRGRRYLYCASSTCKRPSRVMARCANMSSISVVRSMVWVPVSRSIFLTCVAVSSQSKITISASSFLQSSASSASLPEPSTVALSIAGRFCISRATVSAPAVRASSSSSSIEVSASYSPVSAAASITLVLPVLFSCISFPPKCLLSRLVCLMIIVYHKT